MQADVQELQESFQPYFTGVFFSPFLPFTISINHRYFPPKSHI